MFSPLSPSDFVVAERFRWRGIVYEKGSGLPPAIPQGAMSSFLRKDPPLIALKNGKQKGKARVTKKKASKKTRKRG